MVKVKLKTGEELTYEQATRVEYQDGSAVLYATAPGHNHPSFGAYSVGNVVDPEVSRPSR